MDPIEREHPKGAASEPRAARPRPPSLTGEAKVPARGSGAEFAVYCAWCKQYRPGEPPAVTGTTSVPGSSGICPSCRAAFEAEARGRRGLP